MEDMRYDPLSFDQNLDRLTQLFAFVWSGFLFELIRFLGLHMDVWFLPLSFSHVFFGVL